MSAPSTSSPWRSPNRVPTFFTASGVSSIRSLAQIPRIEAVESTVCVVTRKAFEGIPALAIFAYLDHQDRYDVTARTDAFDSLDPREAAKKALAAITGLHVTPKPLRAYVRVDYSELEEKATLIYPYVQTICQYAIGESARLVPFDLEQLRTEFNTARFSDKSDATKFYPTIVHDATLAIDSLK